MTTLTEGDLQITFPSGAHARKFDGIGHGLSNCMKAVDFIVELKDRFLFIEFKDPQDPNCTVERRADFINKLSTGSLDEDLKYKYRDSFLYEWASGRASKPVHYYVLVALDSLTEADLIARTDELNRKLPLHGPPSGQWKKKIAVACAVFNIATWNKSLPSYPIARLPHP